MLFVLVDQRARNTLRQSHTLDRPRGAGGTTSASPRTSSRTSLARCRSCLPQCGTHPGERGVYGLEPIHAQKREETKWGCVYRAQCRCRSASSFVTASQTRYPQTWNIRYPEPHLCVGREDSSISLLAGRNEFGHVITLAAGPFRPHTLIFFWKCSRRCGYICVHGY